MIDYARVAETLKAWRAEYEHDGPAPAIYDPVVIKRTEALTAAAALCEAHAAPVDEAKERAEFEVWYRERFWNVNLARDERGYHKGFVEDDWQVWKAARSDARAKVAEAWQPIESAPKDRKARLVYVPDNKCIYEVYWDEVRLMWITFGGGCVLPYEPTHWQPLPPPPTVEGERG